MRGRMKGLEAHHRLEDPLDETMILTDDVVQVFDLPDFYCAAALSEFQDRVHSFRPVRRAVRDDCALEELPRQGFKERRLWSGSLGIFLGQDRLLLHRGARVFALDSGQNCCDVAGWTPGGAGREQNRRFRPDPRVNRGDDPKSAGSGPSGGNASRHRAEAPGERIGWSSWVSQRD